MYKNVNKFIRKSADAFSYKDVVVIVFTLKRSFYPTTSAVPTVSFLILHLREIQVMWSQTVREKNQIRERIKRGKSSADVPGTRAQQERQPRNKNYEKILNK